MTTLAFLLHGVREANPLVSSMLRMTPHPIGVLLAVKFAAAALGVFCWKMGRERLLQRINILFAVIVVWNILAIIIGSVA